MELPTGLADQVALLEPHLLAKLLLATLLGGLVGWEREASDKPAGLRTNILICVGAALLAHVSIHFATGIAENPLSRPDPARIAAQIVSGIGFLGAGTIIQARGSVTGLTTAATLWVVAAIGIAVGGGSYVAAVGTTILVLVALVPLSWFERWIAERRATSRAWRIELTYREGVVEELEELLVERGMRHSIERVEKKLEKGRVVVYLAVEARREELSGTRRALLAREDVHDLGITRAASPR